MRQPKSMGNNMKTGVLLMNTGTPDAPTVDAIRPYLTEFLMDPAIIDAPYFVRKPLVGHIVSKRPERTVAHYQSFWTDEGSPFLLTSLEQRRLLEESLNAQAQGDFQVALGMRYGNPGIQTGLVELADGGCQRVVLVPFYPQNVNVCAGTCLKEANRILARMARKGWKPQVASVKSFHDQPAYRKALSKSVAAAWEYTPGAKLVVSFHSTMMKDIQQDDTYLVQDTQTMQWLAEDLGIAQEDAILGFQSRFDTRKWLQPFTEQILRDLLKQGVEDVCVVCPGFVADNIETMVEVNRDLRNAFEGKPAAASAKAAPGHVAQDRVEVLEEVARKTRFTYVPALGTDPGLIQAVACAVLEQL